MTPDQMKDASMLELFRLEAEAQTQVLVQGLMALERNPTQADQLEACMRAAHSLKGAARIVGLDAGVQVAHVMEDCLVGAQEGRLLLSWGISTRCWPAPISSCISPMPSPNGPSRRSRACRSWSSVCRPCCRARRRPRPRRRRR